MSDINFLKNSSMIKSESAKKTGSNLSKKLFIASLVVVIVSYAGCFGLNEFFKVRAKMITTDMTEFNNIKQLNSEIKIYDQKINDISQIISKQEGMYAIHSDNLKLIGDLMTNEISIENYTIQDDKSLVIQGKGNNKESIAYFLQRLKDSNAFNAVEVQAIDSTSANKNENTSIYTFTFTLK